MIGELDLFQKEHELSTLLAKCQPGGSLSSSTAAAKANSQNGTATGHGQPMDFPTGSASTTGSVHSTDEIDGTMTRTIKTPAMTPYEGQSIGSGSAENGSFNGSFDEDVTNNGFENPSFRYMNNSQQQQNGHAANSGSVAGSQEIILIQDGELSGDTQKYLQDNSEIVTLRCKDTQRQSMEKKNYASIGLGGIGNDNLIVTKGRTSAGGSNGDGKGGNGNNNNNNNNQQQRLSSFKADAGSALSSPQRSSGSGISTLKRNHSQNYSCDKVATNNYSPMSGASSAAVTDQGQQYLQSAAAAGNHNSNDNNNLAYGNNGCDLSVMESQSPVAMHHHHHNHPMVVQVSPDGKIRSKPTVSPRPTSLSGSL